MPADLVLKECLQLVSQQRAYLDSGAGEEVTALTKSTITQFLDLPEEDLATLRKITAASALNSGVKPASPNQVERGEGFHVIGFTLPGGGSVAQLKDRIAKLKIPADGLPEESLFLGPTVRPWECHFTHNWSTIPC